ncbi:hypothetical protein CYMTET_10541 [Cymbomonas tetramitiformis]|uniref:Uncharacterized protein n=1 Tax=Cymbomonas tetramitiformis TaxID=36881 RepID=A0AAE0GP19_9CHLO|nr:hypothetical protein CYMTET_10541 [Cymbomonas tetramitiformis]
MWTRYAPAHRCLSRGSVLATDKKSSLPPKTRAREIFSSCVPRSRPPKNDPGTQSKQSVILLSRRERGRPLIVKEELGLEVCKEGGLEACKDTPSSLLVDERQEGDAAADRDTAKLSAKVKPWKYERQGMTTIAVVLGLVAGGLAEQAGFGPDSLLELIVSWWTDSNIIERCAPLYILSLVPYLAFLWQLQRSKPQATGAMVFAFAFVLMFVVISTPVEMYSRIAYGQDIANVDSLHFFVQALITFTNFLIIIAFRGAIRNVTGGEN